ncbi:MAG: BMP family ABC transporter substrate-binding protein [Aestuariivita sp.]|nr:BMP family ABC transporter substrate-binding protein [Aestuariivita sp.]
MSSVAEPLKVGFIYVGPTGDHGWTYEHDQGRLALQEALGDTIETTFVESVPEGADSERVLTQMALSDHDLIYTTSFGYMDPTRNVAQKFPKIKFEHATGYKQAENVATYSARFYEGRAVIGHIAGRMTQSNVIGYIASFPIPEVIRGINSAYLHAKAVNPDVQMKIVWVFSWFDPAKEADAAQALIDQGADILMQHTDSPAAINIAEDSGIFAFGQASDMSKFGPNAHLTAIINNWGPYYIERTSAVIDGTWTSGDTWDGIGAGMVTIGTMSDKIPSDVQEEAKALIAAISSGEHHPFTGPIFRQDGSEWLKDGEIADDGTLLGMNFYVDGIESDIPQ